jgi:hypothetical protein
MIYNKNKSLDLNFLGGKKCFFSGGFRGRRGIPLGILHSPDQKCEERDSPRINILNPAMRRPPPYHHKIRAKNVSFQPLKGGGARKRERRSLRTKNLIF